MEKYIKHNSSTYLIFLPVIEPSVIIVKGTGMSIEIRVSERVYPGSRNYTIDADIPRDIDESLTDYERRVSGEIAVCHNCQLTGDGLRGGYGILYARCLGFKQNLAGQNIKAWLEVTSDGSHGNTHKIEQAASCGIPEGSIS